MSCAEHSSKRSCKVYSSDAPYCRREDWWKNPDSGSEEENPPPQHIDKRIGYTFSKKGKYWSIVFPGSGLTEISEVEKKFRYYASKWKNETGADSSLTNITGNMNYLRIIRIGDKAIPLILQELQRETAPWFVALRAISEDDSVGRDSPGNFRKMAAAWIQWGKDHGYI